MTSRWDRFIWGAIGLQFFGYAFDIVWHGLLNPGREPATVAEMLRHLGTVHLPLYVGAASVLVTTAVALFMTARRERPEGALVVAAAAALLSAGAEAWHAYSHLQLDTHSAPLAGILSGVGFLVVVAAMAWRRREVARRVTARGGRPG